MGFHKLNQVVILGTGVDICLKDFWWKTLYTAGGVERGLYRIHCILCCAVCSPRFSFRSSILNRHLLISGVGCRLPPFPMLLCINIIHIILSVSVSCIHFEWISYVFVEGRTSIWLRVGVFLNCGPHIIVYVLIIFSGMNLRTEIIVRPFLATNRTTE